MLISNRPQEIACFILLSCLLLPTIARSGNYEVERKNDITYAEVDGIELKLDLYLPNGVDRPPLVLFIHGGGWKGGSRKGCRLSWIPQHGYAMASIDYRLSHQALFPAQIHDSKGALRWLRAHADEYGYNAEKVVVAGTSAGGHLAALMGTSGGVDLLEGTTAGHSDESSLVQGVVDYFGPTDFVARAQDQPHKTDQSNGSVYQLIGGPVLENLEAAKAASPATYVSEKDPPLLIVHGAKDTTVLLNQSELLKSLYDEAGLDATLLVKQEAKHGWKQPFADEVKVVLGFLEKCFR